MGLGYHWNCETDEIGRLMFPTAGVTPNHSGYGPGDSEVAESHWPLIFASTSGYWWADEGLFRSSYRE